MTSQTLQSAFGDLLLVYVAVFQLGCLMIGGISRNARHEMALVRSKATRRTAR